jgi:hypothetical protein
VSPTGVQRAVACAEPDGGLPADRLCGVGALLSAQWPVATDVRGSAGCPGAFDACASRLGGPRRGARALPPPLPPGVCGGGQAHVTHERSGVVHARQRPPCRDTGGVQGRDPGLQTPGVPRLVVFVVETRPACGGHPVAGVVRPHGGGHDPARRALWAHVASAPGPPGPGVIDHDARRGRGLACADAVIAVTRTHAQGPERADRRPVIVRDNRHGEGRWLDLQTAVTRARRAPGCPPRACQVSTGGGAGWWPAHPRAPRRLADPSAVIMSRR